MAELPAGSPASSSTPRTGAEIAPAPASPSVLSSGGQERPPRAARVLGWALAAAGFACCLAAGASRGPLGQVAATLASVVLLSASYALRPWGFLL